MTNVSTLGPRKALTKTERAFLKIGNRTLLEQNNGRIAAAALMDIVSDWHGTRAEIGFEAYAKGWIEEGGAKNKIADQMLRDLFGMGPAPKPGKRRVA